MFRVQVYEGEILVNDSMFVAAERKEAEAQIQKFIVGYAKSGYDGKQDEWWYRDDGEATKRLVIAQIIPPES
jgi:hypothetical protein